MQTPEIRVYKHVKISLKALFENKKLFWNQKVLRKAFITKIY